MNEIGPATPRAAAGGGGGAADANGGGHGLPSPSSSSDGGGLRRRFDKGGDADFIDDDVDAANTWDDTATAWAGEDVGWRAGRAARAAAAARRRRRGSGRGGAAGGGAGAAAGVAVSVAIVSLLLASWMGGRGPPPPASSLPRPTPTPARAFTPAELALHDGTAPGRPCALAIMGEVYDVAPGARHYGPGGAYAHFAGRDASRAFVTGDFSGPDLTDDVSDFTADQLAALATWRDFYAGHVSYVRVGFLAGGRFYTADGAPTVTRAAVERSAAAEAAAAAAAAAGARSAASVRVSGGGGRGGSRGGRPQGPPGSGGGGGRATGRAARPGPPGGFYARSLPARRSGVADLPDDDAGIARPRRGGGGGAADTPEPCVERADGAVACPDRRHPRFVDDASGGAGSGARCMCYRSQLVSPDRGLPPGCSSEATTCAKAPRKGRFEA